MTTTLAMEWKGFKLFGECLSNNKASLVLRTPNDKILYSDETILNSPMELHSYALSKMFEWFADFYTMTRLD